jgi:hypothetical protein
MNKYLQVYPVRESTPLATAISACAPTEKVKILVLLAMRFIDQQPTVVGHNQHRPQQCTRRRVLNDKKKKKKTNKRKKKTKRRGRRR